MLAVFIITITSRLRRTLRYVAALSRGSCRGIRPILDTLIARLSGSSPLPRHPLVCSMEMV